MEEGGGKKAFNDQSFFAEEFLLILRPERSSYHLAIVAELV